MPRVNFDYEEAGLDVGLYQHMRFVPEPVLIELTQKQAELLLTTIYVARCEFESNDDDDQLLAIVEAALSKARS